MPSIHAIVLVALGGLLGAGPQDDRSSERPGMADPFSAPSNYHAPAPRQPLAAANGTSPVVRLGAPPLPIDAELPDESTDAGELNPTDPREMEAFGAQPAQWNGSPDEVGPPAASARPQPAGMQSPAVPFSSRSAAGPIPLTPPSGNGELLPNVMPTVAWPVVIGSLSGVVGLFLIVAWVMRRGTSRVGGMLPREVVEVLGRAPLADKKQMQLLRLGNKLILISVTQTGTDTLAEITDPVEVDRLTGICYQRHPHSSSVAFQKVFKSFETAPRRKAVRGTQRVDFADLDRLGFDDSSAESDNVH
jgi:flagellar biogenesis protein FliO